jgi:GT2 family glycosyltransferase
VRCLKHEKNFGLSVARNTGIAAATGEIIAFTDSDCRADEDWLYYLVSRLVGGEICAAGGPNLLPPEDSRVAAAVMASPGGPAHVMLTDQEAEHIPGCNMAFFKSALEQIGGFDPIFMKAGDDVDVCWRLQQAGCRIGFSPSAFVWHYRRSTVPAYLRQQEGYGEAEALLVRKHPENFNSFGGGIWQGRIYAPSKFGVELRAPVIYHGLFGSAGFQKIYSSEPVTTLMLCTILEYHLFVTIPLWILSALFHYLLPVAIASLLVPVGICALAGAQAALPKNKIAWWSRPLVALLFFLQPIVRGLARYRGRLAQQPLKLASQESLDSLALFHGKKALDEVQYWAAQRLDRLEYVTAILRRLYERGWPNKSDVGWSEYDVEIFGSRWSHLLLTTVAEDHPQDRQLVRCRLRAVWSFPAKVAFWTLLALQLVFVGLVGFNRPWPWLILLTLPIFGWFVAREKRKLQSVTTVFLDELAKERGLVKIHSDSEVSKST